MSWNRIWTGTGLIPEHSFACPISPPIALEGKTSREAADIQVKGQDKWLTLIQNASKITKNRTRVNIGMGS